MGVLAGQIEGSAAERFNISTGRSRSHPAMRERIATVASRSNSSINRTPPSFVSTGRSRSIPGSVIAHYSRAETYRDLGRVAEALASYDQAIAIDPGVRPRILQTRRSCCSKSLGWRRRSPVMTKSIRTQARSFRRPCEQGVLAVRSRPTRRGALASCDQAIALKPDQASAYVLRGNHAPGTRPAGGGIGQLRAAPSPSIRTIGRQRTATAAPHSCCSTE